MAAPEADWEASKENFQPLKTGRKAAALRDSTAELRTAAIEERRKCAGRGRGWWALAARSGLMQLLPSSLPSEPSAAAAAARRAFWEELAAYGGDDPLEVWLRCGAGQPATPMLSALRLLSLHLVHGNAAPYACRCSICVRHAVSQLLDCTSRQCCTAPSHLRSTPALHAACRFIKWTQETFSAGGHKAELLPLLERCTRELQVGSVGGVT